MEDKIDKTKQKKSQDMNLFKIKPKVREKVYTYTHNIKKIDRFSLPLKMEMRKMHQ